MFLAPLPPCPSGLPEVHGWGGPFRSADQDLFCDQKIQESLEEALRVWPGVLPSWFFHYNEESKSPVLSGVYRLPTWSCTPANWTKDISPKIWSTSLPPSVWGRWEKAKWQTTCPGGDWHKKRLCCLCKESHHAGSGKEFPIQVLHCLCYMQSHSAMHHQGQKLLGEMPYITYLLAVIRTGGHVLCIYTNDIVSFWTFEIKSLVFVTSSNNCLQLACEFYGILLYSELIFCTQNTELFCSFDIPFEQMEGFFLNSFACNKVSDQVFCK